MSIILRLIADLIRIIIRFSFRVITEVLKCFLQLLAWSIRIYGWRKVLQVIAVIILSGWMYFYLIPGAFHSIKWFNIKLFIIGFPAIALVLFSFAKGFIWAGKIAFRKIASKFKNRITNKKNLKVNEYITSGKLWEQFNNIDNLTRAWKRVEENGGSAGPDNITVESFSIDSENLIHMLQHELSSGKYLPQPPRMIEVPKETGGIRKIAVFNVRDRIVLQAINQILIPIWDTKFADCSYAYRPGRSAHKALEAVEKFIKDGRTWIVNADIESFFDSVPHRKLINYIESWLDDEGIKSLITVILKTINPNGIGLSQGSPLSPLLSNLYLHHFDEILLQHGYAVCRYADDFIILCPTQKQAEEALQVSKKILGSLQLNLNEQKTRIVHINDGFNFLGFTFSAEGKRPSDEAVKSLEERINRTEDQLKQKQIENGWKAYFCFDSELIQDNEYNDDDENLWLDDYSKENTESLFPEFQWQIYKMFIGRSDVYAKYWQNKDGQSGYVPIRRQVSRLDIFEHISGSSILGTYLLDESNKTKAVVFDIDGPEMNDLGREKAQQLTVKIAHALSKLGISTLIFDSGGKGRHIWLCFKESLPAKQIRTWAQTFLDKFRPFPEGILIEVFPKQDLLPEGALGSLIRLPLGKHPKTGRFSCLIDINGNPINDPWLALQNYSFVSPYFHEIKHKINEIKVPESIEPMVMGCALLKGLIEKAEKSAQLKHTERLALLYTLGHCGDPGRNYIHQIMSACENYNPRITERFIKRLEPGHRAIRCSRLKEWLKDYLPEIKCDCLKGKNPSPLDLIMPIKKAEVKSTTKLLSDQEWRDISEDIFNLENKNTD